MQFVAFTREERKRKERERDMRERETLVFLRVLCRLVEKERQDDERTH